MRPKVIAHRGASYLAPENTLASFRLAIEQGADGIELDVVPSKDGHLMVHHDYIIDMHTDARGIIPDLTLDELRKLDFGSWKSPAYAGEKIPTFEEAMELCREVEYIHVEFKSPLFANDSTDQDRFAEMIVDKISNSGLAGKIVSTSFNIGILRRVKALSPDLQVGFLTLNSLDSYLSPPPALLELLGFENGALPDGLVDPQALLALADDPDLAEENGALYRWVQDRIWAITADHPGENLFELIGSLAAQHDLAAYLAGLDFKPEFLGCQYNTCFRDTTLVQRVQQMGIQVAPWPVDRKLDVRSILDMRPDVIVTNRPDRVIAMLDEDTAAVRAALAPLDPVAALKGGR